MLENLIPNNIALDVVILIAVYAASYYLTLYRDAVYHSGADKYIEFESAYDLMPMLQSDVDKHRLFSPLFTGVIVGLGIATVALWWFFVVESHRPEFFSLVFGGLVLLEVADIIREVRLIELFRHARAGRLAGRIEYPPRIRRAVSAVESYSFAALYLVTFLVTGSWFFLGGALVGVVAGRRQRDYAVISRK